MDLITNKEFDHIRVDKDQGSILVDDTYIIPIGPTPLYATNDSINVISGWPLRGVFPNQRYDSRIEIDKDIFLADMVISPCRVHSPRGLRWTDDMALCHTISPRLSISNIDVTWSLCSSQYSIKIEDESVESSSILIQATADSYYIRDNGNNLTDPIVEGISNHYIVKYAALDRLYGRMKHGWFWADTSGTWQWSVDGTDVVEIAIDDGVVASKYSNSAAVGVGVLYGSVDLVVGWHHMFAYTSDRADAAKPEVWFKRPGDTNWNELSTDNSDGLMWNRTAESPSYTEFSYTAGNITASLYVDQVDPTNLIFDADLFNSGPVSIEMETVPRYSPYYTLDLRESTLEALPAPTSLPPRFENMRAILYFYPLAELVFYSEFTEAQEFDPRFVISPVGGGTQWYMWDGAAFQTVTINSVDDLLTLGNDLYSINHVPESAWSGLLSGEPCRLMFTGETPLLATYHKGVFSGMSHAEYIIGNRAHLSGNIRVQRRSI